MRIEYLSQLRDSHSVRTPRFYVTFMTGKKLHLGGQFLEHRQNETSVDLFKHSAVNMDMSHTLAA
jgi:hypothetical protein